MTERSKPWVMRTYSGHSTAVRSNELYRSNLAKGQTGLSIAFDLPTQTGYDPDDPAAAGEVGKVGVPVAHLGHMRQLLAGIPLGEMNTSMTINATAAWLWGLYLALGIRDVAAEQPRGRGVDRHRGVHLAERDAGHQSFHVAAVGDRHADLSDLAARQLVAGVVAGLCRQVKGDREAGLPLFEVAAVQLVRGLRGRMARVGAHHPRAVTLLAAWAGG